MKFQHNKKGLYYVYASAGCISTRDMNNMIKMNQLPSCLITIENIKAVKNVYGKEMGALKGKTVRTKLDPAVSWPHHPTFTSWPHLLTYT
eukprot:10310153-Ditylum_brightwellii.AAC.1